MLYTNKYNPAIKNTNGMLSNASVFKNVVRIMLAINSNFAPMLYLRCKMSKTAVVEMLSTTAVAFKL